jgi:hypothetical protein
MTEHAIEFLQISARLAGSAFEGLGSGPGPALVLSLSAVLFALVVARSGSGSAAPEGIATVPDSPSAPWEADPSAAVAAVVADSKSGAAGAVLAVETPGGGE